MGLNDPAKEGLNPNLFQTEDLLSSMLTTKKQELIGETTAESTHLNLAVRHEEQDRMCEAKCPAVDEQAGTRSGAGSGEAPHGEGGR